MAFLPSDLEMLERMASALGKPGLAFLEFVRIAQDNRESFQQREVDTWKKGHSSLSDKALELSKTCIAQSKALDAMNPLFEMVSTLDITDPHEYLGSPEFLMLVQFAYTMYKGTLESYPAGTLKRWAKININRPGKLTGLTRHLTKNLADFVLKIQELEKLRVTENDVEHNAQAESDRKPTET